MSLINQVLQDMEKRQGMPPPSGLGGQVRPVLGAPAPQHAWPMLAKGLLGLALLAGLVYAYLRWDGFPGAQSPATYARLPAQAAMVTTKSPPVPAAPPMALAQAPQLTRQLFTDWQTAAAGQPAVIHRPITAGQPAIEGSMMPGVNTATAIATDITARPVSKAMPAQAMVNKQMKPEQEANLLIQRALDHEQKGRTSEALALLRQAVQQYPQSEDARQLLVSYLLDSRQDAEALTLLQDGIRAYPEQLLLRKSLAKWQLSHEQPQKALETLKPAAAASVQDAEWQWLMAMASQHAGYHGDALPYFEHALRLQSGQVQTYVAYAVSLQATGQNRQALEQLRQAQDLPMSERMSEFVNQRMRQLSQQE